MRFHLPVLPYELDALEPHMSAETLEYHYGKHHKAYIDKTNQLLEAPTAWQDELTLEGIVQTSSGPLFNNAAQAWNHSFFWHCLAPKAKGEPKGELMDAILASFGSFEHFKQVFSDKAVGVFGSGWTWLIKDRGDRLSVVTTANGDTPIVGDELPLLTLDVWEHAYYIDYRNQRAKFVEAFWKLVNWDFVAENFKSDTAANMTRLMTETTDMQRPAEPPRPQPSV
jgi:Fe-Mn family superoxide dismutase